MAKFHHLPHIDTPRDLNEWIMHLEFRTDTSQWTDATDKLAVRSLVEARGLGDMLPRLYAWGHSAAEIDFDALPRQFVIKANNGCGTIRLVRDKARTDIDALRREADGWLHRPFGYLSAEPHYTRIAPRLLVEELLPCGGPGRLPVDFKIWCINGEPVGCMVCTNRSVSNLHKVNLNWYDLPGWTRRPEYISAQYANSDETPRPRSLERMIEAARRLSAGFRVVRVDLYDVEGRPYVGELTFTSNGGRMSYLTPALLQRLGAMAAAPTPATDKDRAAEP